MKDDTTIKIFLVDDHSIMRQGLRVLIEAESDMEVIGEAGNGRETVQQVRELEPDVVIMDITLPDLNGIDATRILVSEFPQLKIIALSMHSNRIFVEEMMDAGAFGYLLKSCVFDELVDGIRTVYKNKAFYSSKLTQMVAEKESVVSPESDLLKFPELTNREREVLQLLAEGHTTKEIAELLFITSKAVEKHRHFIKEKLNLRSTAELTKYAIQIGLTSPEL